MKLCVMAVACCFTVLSTIVPVYGVSKSCVESSDGSCQKSLGFYLTGGFGMASASRSRADFQQASDQTIAVNELSVTDNDQALTFGAGYQFTPIWSIEGGFVDLGLREVSLINTTLDPNNFPSLVDNIFPESGSGYQLGVVGSFPMTDRLSLAAKLGVFDVEQTYQILLNQKVALDVTRKTTDITYGGEMQYQLSDNSQLYLSFSRYQMDRDVNDMLSLGFRYYFNGPNPRKAPSMAKPEGAVSSSTDTDNDGVTDRLDRCPASDSKYKVDDYGCTFTTELKQQHRYVIHFEHNSDVVTDEYQSELEHVARLVNDKKITRFTLFGHASSLGTEAYNQSLSEARAAAVSLKLRGDIGVTQPIKSMGMGETKLLDPADTAFAHALNRRVEIVIQTVSILPVTANNTTE